MAAQRALPQSKEALLKSYTTRLKEDVKSMLENFEGMLYITSLFARYIIIRESMVFFLMKKRCYVMQV